MAERLGFSIAQLLKLRLYPLPRTVRRPADDLHDSPTLPVLDELEVSEASVDAMSHFRKAPSFSLACRAIGRPEDGREKALVAFLPVAHHDEILGLLEPPLGRDHKLPDERLVTSSSDEADQKPAFRLDRGRFPKGFLLAPGVPVTLVHLYRGR